MKVLFIYFLIFISFNSYTQESEFEIQKKIYSKSKIYNDPTVSITALYKMISLQPENLNLLDTLLREYIGVSRWPSAYMVSREILSNNPENLFALEVSCIALQNLGLKQESLNEYESLYLKTDRDDIINCQPHPPSKLILFTRDGFKPDIINIYLFSNKIGHFCTLFKNYSRNFVKLPLKSPYQNYSSVLLMLQLTKSKRNPSQKPTGMIFSFSTPHPY